MTTFSYEEIIEERKPQANKKKVLVAFCGSKKCAGTRALIEKSNVARHSSFCPDCGYSLVWKYINKKYL